MKHHQPNNVSVCLSMSPNYPLNVCMHIQFTLMKFSSRLLWTFFHIEYYLYSNVIDFRAKSIADPSLLTSEQTKWSVGSSRKRGVPTTYPPKCVGRVTEFQAVFSLAFWFQTLKGELFLWTSLRTPFLKKSVSVLLDPKYSVRLYFGSKSILTRFFFFYFRTTIILSFIWIQLSFDFNCLLKLFLLKLLF